MAKPQGTTGTTKWREELERLDETAFPYKTRAYDYETKAELAEAIERAIGSGVSGTALRDPNAALFDVARTAAIAWKSHLTQSAAAKARSANSSAAAKERWAALKAERDAARAAKDWATFCRLADETKAIAADLVAAVKAGKASADLIYEARRVLGKLATRAGQQERKLGERDQEELVKA